MNMACIAGMCWKFIRCQCLEIISVQYQLAEYLGALHVNVLSLGGFNVLKLLLGRRANPCSLNSLGVSPPVHGSMLKPLTFLV